VLSCNDRGRNYGNPFIAVAFIFHQISIKRYFYVVEVEYSFECDRTKWLTSIGFYAPSGNFLGTLKYRVTIGVRWVISKKPSSLLSIHILTDTVIDRIISSLQKIIAISALTLKVS